MKFIITFSLSICLTIFKGFVLVDLWQWFLIPIFALPIINIPQAIGLAYVSALFTPINTNDKSDVVDKLMTGGIYVGLIWLFSFVIHTYFL